MLQSWQTIHLVVWIPIHRFPLLKDLCAPHTVLTDSRLGLTDTDADLAIAVLLSDVDASSRGAQQQAPDEKKKKMKKKKKSERR